VSGNTRSRCHAAFDPLARRRHPLGRPDLGRAGRAVRQANRREDGRSRPQLPRHLAADARKKAAFAFDDPNRTAWYFTPQQDKQKQALRKGLRLEEMTADQKAAAIALLKAGLSEKGYEQASTIIVNATPDEWSKPQIDYADVVTLFDPAYPQHPQWTYSVKYKHGPSENPHGILSQGDSVKVKERMVFHVKCTGES